MNKRAVTKAQLRRAIETVEAMGKTVCGVRVGPDGSAEVLIGEPHGGTPVAADADDDRAALRAFEAGHANG